MLQGRPGMLSKALLVSEEDIETIKEFQTTGYILNNNNVYQFNTGSYTNMIKLTNMADSIKYFCPQIDHF